MDIFSGNNENKYDKPEELELELIITRKICELSSQKTQKGFFEALKTTKSLYSFYNKKNSMA